MQFLQNEAKFSNHFKSPRHAVRRFPVWLSLLPCFFPGPLNEFPVPFHQGIFELNHRIYESNGDRRLPLQRRFLYFPVFFPVRRCGPDVIINLERSKTTTVAVVGAKRPTSDKLVSQFLPNLADLRPRIGIEIFSRIAKRELIASRGP
jgi:hypothetical protein